jgi:hypothetical protein
MKLGKFFFDRDLIEDDDAARVIFKLLEFVPYRTEYLGYNGKVEYIGTSPKFKDVSKAVEAPEYTIIIHHDDNDEIIGVSVQDVLT